MQNPEMIRPHKEIEALAILTRTDIAELSKLTGIKTTRLRGFFNGFQVLELIDINRCQKLLEDRLLDIVRTTGEYIKTNGGTK